MKHLLFALLICPAVNAQITGTVTDAEKKGAITSAEIFINRTAIGSASDNAGRFQLYDILPGLKEIIIYKEGYALYKSFVSLQAARTYNINIALKPLPQSKLTNISKEESQLLNKLLVGESDDKTSVVNLGDIQKNNNSNFVAKGPLVIRNESTGYQIKCFLADVPMNDVNNAPLKFEILPYENIQDGIVREKSRLKAFKGSLRHWLMEMALNQSGDKGYTIYNESGIKIDAVSLVTHTATSGYFRLDTKSRIEVRFKDEEGRVEISYAQVVDLVDFDKSGVLINPKSLNVTGKMTSRGIANQLPIDYWPVEDVEAEFARGLNKVFEKVYVHTDKPYYYPSEQIWFKAYMNYYFPEGRGLLSKTLYVELVNARNRIFLQKKLRLDSGFASNNFVLPDTLKPGQYFLRAYTQNQRNFGDENLYLKALSVLAPNVKPVFLNEPEIYKTEGLTVIPDKSSYGKRESVAISIILKDSLGRPLSGNLSISVTDASQVLNIGQASSSIIKQFPIKNHEINKVFDLVYPIEHGLTLKGQFTNSKRKTGITELTVAKFQPYQVSMVTTDDQGLFEISNVDFNDDAAFSIKPLKDDGGKKNKIVFSEREHPALTLPQRQESITLVEMQSVQRILSEYEKPADSKMLETVTIKSEKDKNTVARNIGATARPYGVGEYVFDESKIKTQFPNLLYTLQSLNISGLIVNPVTATIFFARHMKPVMYMAPGVSADDEARRYTPLVTLDNMPLVGGSAGEILVGIPTANVGSVEVTKAGTRGTMAPFGLIAVYTKNGLSSAETQNIGPGLIRVRGYDTSPQFQHPSYEAAGEEKAVDFRSTLYWNPAIKIDPKTALASVYFYTSSLVGSYRIEVEGVDANGRPLRSVSFIEVRD